MTDLVRAGERFAADLERTADRLRGLGLPRLAASFEPEPTRADAGHALAQRLADSAAELSGAARLTVPRIADAAVGDQIAVCGRELALAATAHDGDVAAGVLIAAADALLDLRRRV